jgi:hypothetical protein
MRVYSETGCEPDYLEPRPLEYQVSILALFHTPEGPLGRCFVSGPFAVRSLADDVAATFAAKPGIMFATIEAVPPLA